MSPATVYRAVNFFSNWATDEMDLICKPLSDYQPILESQFVFYFLGAVFMTMPDTIGRIGTMYVVGPLHLAFGALSIYSTDYYLKTLGYIVQGILHIKIPISFLHMCELVPDSSKIFSLSVVTAFDSATLGWICIAIELGATFNQCIIGFWVLGVIGITMLLTLVPEAPVFYFLKEGPNSKNGIDSLNYIAWFNGSKYRIPDTAYF